MNKQQHVNLTSDSRNSGIYTFIKPVLIFAGSFLLILTAVYCTFGALVSSFSIQVEMKTLLGIWAVCTVLVSGVATRYRGKGLLILSVPVIILFIWNINVIIDGARLVIFYVTNLYSKWLPVTVMFREAPRQIDHPTFFLAAAGIFIIFLLAFTICLRRSVFNTILVTAPIIFLTFVITDLQADNEYLIGIIAVYLTMLICSAISPDDYIKRGLAVLPALIIAVILMLTANLIAPYSSYEREKQIAELGNRLRYVASQMGRFGQYWQTRPGAGWGSDIAWLRMFDGGMWQFNTSNVNISSAGNRIITNQGLMEIVVDHPGTYYIRGYSMQTFNGQTWSGNDESYPNRYEGYARAMPAFLANLTQLIDYDNPPVPVQMTITKTGDQTPRVYYRPYYGGNTGSFLNIFPDLPEGRFYHIEGSVHSIAEALKSTDLVINVNSDLTRNIIGPMFGLENFTITIDGDAGWDVYIYTETPDGITSYRPDLPGLPGEFTNYIDWIRNTTTYTQINPATAQELRQLAIDAGIDPNAERAVIVDAVAKYIISSGRYTLEPEAIPRGEDFSLYFLQTLKEGYCIHFATAAVQMLRSMDIPARFTSGYVATIQRSSVGVPVVLTDRNAHAWVEVFYEDVGWLYLEVTPAGGQSIIPEQRPHTPPVETPAPQTTPPTSDPTPPPEPTPPPDIDNNETGGSRPVTGDDPGQSRFEIPEQVFTIVLLIGCIVIIILILPVRRSLVIKKRTKKLKQTSTNKAAIYAWRYIQQLSRYEPTVSAHIEEIALKARFSQHRLTEEERNEAVKYSAAYALKLYNGSSWLKRFWIKYVRALI